MRYTVYTPQTANSRGKSCDKLNMDQSESQKLGQEATCLHLSRWHDPEMTSKKWCFVRREDREDHSKSGFSRVFFAKNVSTFHRYLASFSQLFINEISMSCSNICCSERLLIPTTWGIKQWPKPHGYSGYSRPGLPEVVLATPDTILNSFLLPLQVWEFSRCP